MSMKPTKVSHCRRCGRPFIAVKASGGFDGETGRARGKVLWGCPKWWHRWWHFESIVFDEKDDPFFEDAALRKAGFRR